MLTANTFSFFLFLLISEWNVFRFDWFTASKHSPFASSSSDLHIRHSPSVMYHYSFTKQEQGSRIEVLLEYLSQEEAPTRLHLVAWWMPVCKRCLTYPFSCVFCSWRSSCWLLPTSPRASMYTKMESMAIATATEACACGQSDLWQRWGANYYEEATGQTDTIENIWRISLYLYSETSVETADLCIFWLMPHSCVLWKLEIIKLDFSNRYLPGWRVKATVSIIPAAEGVCKHLLLIHFGKMFTKWQISYHVWCHTDKCSLLIS